MPDDQPPSQSPRATMADTIAAIVTQQKGLALAPELRLQIEAAQGALNRFMASFQDQIDNALKSPAVAALKAAIPDLTIVAHAMREAFEAVPEKVRIAMIGLGMRGWYLDPEMPYVDFMTLYEISEAGDHDRVDQEFSDYFEARLEEVEAATRASFPHRAKILQAAIGAHRRGEFELSVPVLLSQADGVCFELTGSSYFTIRNGAPVVSQQLSHLDQKYQGAWLAPLMIVLPVAMSEKASGAAAAKETRPGWMELNRHTVLHGKDVTYGTRLNSLKALSLLNYLVTIAAPILREGTAE